MFSVVAVPTENLKSRGPAVLAKGKVEDIATSVWLPCPGQAVSSPVTVDVVEGKKDLSLLPATDTGAIAIHFQDLTADLRSRPVSSSVGSGSTRLAGWLVPSRFSTTIATQALRSILSILSCCRDRIIIPYNPRNFNKEER